MRKDQKKFQKKKEREKKVYKKILRIRDDLRKISTEQKRLEFLEDTHSEKCKTIINKEFYKEQALKDKEILNKLNKNMDLLKSIETEMLKEEGSVSENIDFVIE